MKPTRVYKYPLTLRSGPQPVEMPFDATVVHVHEQNINGEAHVVLWAVVRDLTRIAQRTYQVAATGESVQSGGRYVGTAHIDWTVWHVFDLAGP